MYFMVKPVPLNTHSLYVYVMYIITFQPGISVVCAPKSETLNSLPASKSFNNTAQNSSGPLSCSLQYTYS